MIEQKKIEELIQNKTANSDMFLVEVKVDNTNNISVTIDTPQGLSIDQCVEINRYIEENFDRETEDYSLEVSSPGIGQPFKVYQQYIKTINKPVELLFNSGTKIKGTLKAATQIDITIEYETKEKPEGAKRPKKVIKTEVFKLEDIKTTKEILKIS